MTPLWLGIAVMAAGCYALKYAGLSVPEHILNHPVTIRAADLIPVALLGALIVVQIFADGQAITIDARLLGLAVAAGLLWLRAPFLVVVFGAAAAAALLRLI